MEDGYKDLLVRPDAKSFVLFFSIDLTKTTHRPNMVPLGSWYTLVQECCIYQLEISILLRFIRFTITKLERNKEYKNDFSHIIENEFEIELNIS